MITYNAKLKFLTPEHQAYWYALLVTATEAYNFIAKLVYDSKCPLTDKAVHALVYYPTREKFPSIPAQAVVRMWKDVVMNMRAMKKRICPHRMNPSMRLDKRLYSNFSSISIKLPTSKPMYRQFVDIIGYPKFNELASKYGTTDPLIFIKNGEFYLSVTFDIPEKPVMGEDRLGVDLGIRRIFTTSDGLSYSGKDLNRIKRRLRYNKRKLQSIAKTNKSKSAIRKLKKLSHKERNINKNYTHLICNKILDTDKSVIVLEDLTGIKERTKKTKSGYKRTKHNNRISQVPFYMIKQILTYKAPLLGKKVETVSPAYTSQTNSLTGKKDGERKGCRYYTKKKGLVLDADWNAAINIAKRYSRHSQSYSVPIDGKIVLLRQAVCQPANSGKIYSYSQAANSLTERK